MESEIKELKDKIDQMYLSVEKLRKYFKWTMIITILVIVLPLIGLLFVLPSFFTNYVGQLNSLGNF